MVKYKLIVLLHAWVILASTSSLGQETEGKFETSITEDYSYRYLLNGKQRENLPLIVYLHGSGERSPSTARLKKDQVYKALVKANLQAVILAPVCEPNKRWNSQALNRLVKKVSKEMKVDKHRIYFIGYSMGAFGVWEIAVRFPNEIAAIVPIAGGGEVSEASKVKHMPIWAFHGKNDKAVLSEYSINMVENVNKNGGSAKLTLFDDVGHGCFPDVMKTDFLAWMMRQNSKPSE